MSDILAYCALVIIVLLVAATAIGLIDWRS